MTEPGKAPSLGETASIFGQAAKSKLVTTVSSATFLDASWVQRGVAKLSTGKFFIVSPLDSRYHQLLQKIFEFDWPVLNFTINTAVKPTTVIRNTF